MAAQTSQRDPGAYVSHQMCGKVDQIPLHARFSLQTCANARIRDRRLRRCLAGAIQGCEISLAAWREPISALQRFGQSQSLEPTYPQLVRAALLTDLGSKFSRDDTRQT